MRASSTAGGARDRGTLDPLSDRRQTRASGRKAVAEAQRKRRRIQRAIFAIGGVAILAIAGALIYNQVTGDETVAEDSRITTGTATASDPGLFVAPLTAQHVAQGTRVTNYNSNPPTSGDHWPITAPWGISDVPLDDELTVHNLEHGGIVIQYDCPNGCQDVVDQLSAIVSSYPVKLILAPRSDMKHEIALTAWSRLLTMDTLDVNQVQAFIDAYIDKGPEKIQSETDLLNQSRP